MDNKHSYIVISSRWKLMLPSRETIFLHLELFWWGNLYFRNKIAFSIVSNLQVGWKPSRHGQKKNLFDKIVSKVVHAIRYVGEVLLEGGSRRNNERASYITRNIPGQIIGRKQRFSSPNRTPIMSPFSYYFAVTVNKGKFTRNIRRYFNRIDRGYPLGYYII